MKIQYGKGKTKYGPGVLITLSGSEVAIAISAYLVSHEIYVGGPITVKVNGDLCESGSVYIDPSGFVIANGEKLNGDGQKLN